MNPAAGKIRDGSVRGIMNTINPAIWVAVGTRAGREPVSLDF